MKLHDTLIFRYLFVLEFCNRKQIQPTVNEQAIATIKKCISNH